MINVYIRKSGNHYNEYEITGHANYATNGKDIVCAAVSALEDSMLVSLENMNVLISKTQYINEHASITLIDPNEYTDVVLSVFENGISRLEEAYPDYVKLHLET